MSLLGLPAQVIDRLLGTTASRPVPVDVNGHADFDDEKPLRIDAQRLRERLGVAYDDRDHFRIQARRLGKAYGRASATIGEQRGTIASLRAQLAAISTIEAPEHSYDEPLPEWEQELLFTETPGAPCGGDATGKPGQVDRGDRRDAGEAAGGHTPPPGGADNDQRACARCDDRVHTLSSRNWCDGCEDYDASRRERWADDVREGLAQVMSRAAFPGREECPDALRELYLGYADAVINAGWLPPREAFDVRVERIGGDLAALGLLKPPRSAVVRVLTDHELLTDGACRCGWGDWPPTPERVDPFELWHAEHVAEQLALQGIGAPDPTPNGDQP